MSTAWPRLPALMLAVALGAACGDAGRRGGAVEAPPLPDLAKLAPSVQTQVRDDGTRDVEWYAADGAPMGARWDDDPGLRLLQMFLAGATTGDASTLLVLNGGREDAEVTLPDPPGRTAYRLLWDSSHDRPPLGASEGLLHPGDSVRVPATSMRLYATSEEDGPAPKE